MPISIVNDSPLWTVSDNSCAAGSSAHLHRRVSFLKRPVWCPEHLLDVFDLVPIRLSNRNSQGPTIRCIVLRGCLIVGTITYLVEIGAEWVGKSIDFFRVKLVSIFRTTQGDARPCCVDMYPKRRMVLHWMKDTDRYERQAHELPVDVHTNFHYFGNVVDCTRRGGPNSCNWSIYLVKRMNKWG